MSKFVQSITIEPLTFQGEQITATLRPIKRKLFVQLLPIMQSFNAVRDEIRERIGSDDEAALKVAMGNDPQVMAAMSRALDIVAPELKDYVSEFKGPTDAAGNPVSLETVMEAAYFIEVALHLVMCLAATTAVKEEDAGKSGGPSGG